jgi:hypothetical protein
MIAAYTEGRSFVGAEILRKYFDLAVGLFGAKLELETAALGAYVEVVV